MGAKQIHNQILNLSGAVMETDVNYQAKKDDRMVIVHDPAFVRVPETVQTTEASTPTLLLLAPLNDPTSFDLLAPFTVPSPPPGFFWKASFGTSVGFVTFIPNLTIPGRAFVTQTFQVQPGVLAPKSSTSVVTSGIASASSTSFAPKPIAPGDYVASLRVKADLIDGRPFLNVTASIGIKLVLTQILVTLKIALPNDPHRGNLLSIVATNTNVEITSPLSTSVPSETLTTLAPGERADLVFTGVEDPSLSAQWQLGLLNPAGGPQGLQGEPGDTIIGPRGPQGPTGPIGPTGPTGLSSPSDFISVSKQTNETIFANNDMVFDVLLSTEGPTFSGATLPITNFIPQRSGTYNLYYFVRGVAHDGFDALDYTRPIEFALFESGVEIPGTHSVSEPNAVSPSFVTLSSVVTLTAGLVYTLHNVGANTSLDGGLFQNAHIYFSAA